MRTAWRVTKFALGILYAGLFVGLFISYKRDVEFECLRDNIYREARGEPELGQILTGLVTLERTKLPGFRKTICDVVWQRRTIVAEGRKIIVPEFSWTIEPALREPIREGEQKNAIGVLARELLDGKHNFPKEYPCRPVYYKRTDDKGVGKRGKEFFATKLFVAAVGNHSFYCESTLPKKP